MNTFILRLQQRIDRLADRTGRWLSWLVIVLVLVVSYDVSMRYLFQSGSIGLQELQWHLFSVLFLIGAGYTLKHDGHVRLDILYRSGFLTDRQRAWIDVFGTLFILVPFCILIIASAWPFVQQAYIANETSPDPGGLPARWLVKSMIQAGFLLLLLQAVAELIRKLNTALGGDG